MKRSVLFYCQKLDEAAAEGPNKGGIEMHDTFFDELYEFVISDVNLDTYRNMDEGKRRKLIMKQTILACKEFAPRKNYDMSRDEVYGLIAAFLKGAADIES